MTGSEPRRRTARTTYVRWLHKGMTPREAGNLTAAGIGLRPVETGWTPVQIERVLWLRWLWERGEQFKG
jgi:hypothetical protein